MRHFLVPRPFGWMSPVSVCADENKVYKEAGNEEDEEGEKDEDNEDLVQDVPQCMFVLGENNVYTETGNVCTASLELVTLVLFACMYYLASSQFFVIVFWECISGVTQAPKNFV